MLLAGDMEQPFAAKHIRKSYPIPRACGLADPVRVSGNIIEKVFVGIEDRNFLHLLVGKTDEIALTFAFP